MVFKTGAPRCVLFLTPFLLVPSFLLHFGATPFGHVIKDISEKNDAPPRLRRLPKSQFRAVTILHEPCSTIGYTLANFASNLGPEWPVLVLHNDDVLPSLRRNKIVRLQEKHGILRTASLERNGFPALSSSNTSSYSRLLASTRFWTMLKAEHVLLFQTDSVLCSMSPWTVNDFLRYDYVGAPWIDRWYGMDIGNGGLSLRKTKTMIRITRRFKYEDGENEDIYFGRGVYKLAQRDPSVQIPPVHVAAKFAYEAGRLPLVTSFGVHKTRFREVDREAIVETCPEAMAGVWDGCEVDTFDEEEATRFTTTAASTEARAKRGGEAREARGTATSGDGSPEIAASSTDNASSVEKAEHGAALFPFLTQPKKKAGHRFLAADLLATSVLDFESDYRV